MKSQIQIFLVGILVLVATSSFADTLNTDGHGIKEQYCIDNRGEVLSIEYAKVEPIERYGLCKFGFSQIELSTFAKAKTHDLTAVRLFLGNLKAKPEEDPTQLVQNAIQYCESNGGVARTAYDRENKRFYSTCFFRDYSEIGLFTLYIGANDPRNSTLKNILTL